MFDLIFGMHTSLHVHTHLEEIDAKYSNHTHTQETEIYAVRHKIKTFMLSCTLQPASFVWHGVYSNSCLSLHALPSRICLRNCTIHRLWPCTLNCTLCRRQTKRKKNEKSCRARGEDGGRGRGMNKSKTAIRKKREKYNGKKYKDKEGKGTGKEGKCSTTQYCTPRYTAIAKKANRRVMTHHSPYYTHQCTYMYI